MGRLFFFSALCVVEFPTNNPDMPPSDLTVLMIRTNDQEFSMTSTVAIILGLCLMLPILTLLAVSRHKKSATDQMSLVGLIGTVDKDLEPHGSVLIQGELWRASSSDGIRLATGLRIEVIGTRDHLLLVKRHTE